LKPANEPICLARKPLSEKTIAANVLKWGTGGINIDACRIGSEVRTTPVGSNDSRDDKTLFGLNSTIHHKREETTEGRFPSNIILDEEAGKVLGEPSRFFYCPKVNKKERNAGCEDLETKKVCQGGYDTDWSSDKEGDIGINKVKEYKNNHPTVKPIELMAYLCRLVTPPNGIVLDPFMGSGSTGCAAVKEGFRFCGMEMDKDYFEIAKKRIEHYNGKKERTKV
jgi:site-specific DNA-methyltransferase (adenine-specific)